MDESVTDMEESVNDMGGFVSDMDDSAISMTRADNHPI
jgi:hypothetical protein